MVSLLPKNVTQRLAELALFVVLLAVIDAASAKINAGSDGVAVHGYDAVAYFLEGRAVRGVSEFEHNWQDAAWHFSSSANKDLFAADPERYAPQYGGFCATCLALDGELSDANPKAWSIVDGKLYLNYSMHQRTQWRIRASTFVKFGDDEWAKLLAREKKRAVSQSLIRVAILPPYGRETGGEVIRHEILPNVLHETIDESEAFAISFSSLSPDTGQKVDIPEGLWSGHPRIDFPHPAPPAELVERVGKQLGVSGVLLYSYKVSAPLTEVSVTQDQFNWKGYFFDVGQGRVYEQQGDQASLESSTKELLAEFLKGRKQSASGESYRIAVMKPAFLSATGANPDPAMVEDLGASIYKSIRQQPSFSITHADEPGDPSALSYLNRGGDWPFPPTNVEPNETWRSKAIDKVPNLERLYRAGQELQLDAVVMWYYKPQYRVFAWPVEVYVIDIQEQHVYLHKGSNTEVDALVREALDDFRAGREGYRIAVVKPAYYYSSGGIPNPNEIGDLGSDFYAAIREQPSFSITHADEPVDPSALGYLNRGGDWPFPPTNVDPKEAWQGGVVRKTPNLERLYRAGQDLGLDAVVMWFYKPLWNVSQYPVELYVIDIQQKRVYSHEGHSSEVAVLVRQAFADYVAGR